MPRVNLSPADKLIVDLTTMSDNELASVRNIASALLAKRRQATQTRKPRTKKKDDVVSEWHKD